MDITAEIFTSISLPYAGYIAGSGDGIVTVGGQPASRHIYLLDANTMAFIGHTISLPNGHYLFIGLDTDRQYIVMARDYKREYEPAVFDYVTPATDLTLAQQQELWQSWQTSP